MRCASVWMYLLASLAGCGEPTSSVDAQVADAAPPDAVQCSVAPAPVPGPPDTFERQIVFDVLLPEPGEKSPAQAVLLVGAELLVLSYRAIHRLTLDGVVLASTPLAAPGAARVELQGAVRGDGHHGVLVGINGGPSAGNHFCVLDASGGFDVQRCAPVAGLQYGPLVFDGTAYHLYRVADGRLRRDRYDATPTLQLVPDFPASDGSTASVIAAAATPNAEYVLTFDNLEATACPRAREHVITTSGEHRAREVFPPDASFGSWGTTGQISVDTSGGVSMLTRASCETAGCERARETTTLLTTYEGDAIRLDALAIPSEPARVVALRDEGRTIVLGETTVCENESPSCFRCSTRGELARFADDGSAELYGVEVVPGQDGTQINLIGAVIGAGDYALAYVTESGLRITRVLVP